MAEEIQWASCGAIKVMELCDKPIAIKIVDPTEPHIRAYITVGGSYPLNHNPHPQRKRMTLIHQWVTLTGVGVLCNTSRQSLKTSKTRNCGNSWRISVRRLHFVSSMHPQQSSTNSLPNFPRGGGWVPLRQPSPTPALAQPQPLGPALADPDVEHLINTLALGL